MKPVLKKILKAFALYVCIPLIILKFVVFVVVIVLLVISCFDSNSGKPVYSREKAASPIYRSGEDLYKLTGVRFPEISVVDSVFLKREDFQPVHGGMSTNMFLMKVLRMISSRHWIMPARKIQPIGALQNRVTDIIFFPTEIL